jgi:hypothetical protein
MAKKVEMVAREPKKYQPARTIRIEKRVILSRKDTNHEVIEAAFAKDGVVKLRIVLSICSADKIYLGFKNTAVIVSAPSVESAELFPAKLREVVAQLAEELGMTAIRKDQPI